MSYSIVEVEITQQLPTSFPKESDRGIAFIVRRKSKPIGFLMHSLPPNDVLTPADLAGRLSEEIGANLLKESIRDELFCSTHNAQIPSVTVAICTKDRPENLARCLESVLRLEANDSSRCFEILVVDNAPSDERTKAIADSLHNIRYVCEPKPGLDFARNRALLEATGEIIAYLDDDVVVDRYWLNGLVEAWTENTDAAAFTGLVLPYELATEAQILFEQRGGFRRGFEKIRYGQFLPDNPLYPCGAGIFGAGCNMAFRRAVLLELGGFDEALDTGSTLPGGGDLDIFYRVIRAGYPLVYEPNYLAFHQHRRDLEGLRRQYWTWGLGFMSFLIKSYQQDPPQRLKFGFLALWWFRDQLQQLGWSLLGRHVLPPKMILAELWGGLVGLFGEYHRSSRRIAKIKQMFS